METEDDGDENEEETKQLKGLFDSVVISIMFDTSQFLCSLINFLTSFIYCYTVFWSQVKRLQ